MNDLEIIGILKQNKEFKNYRELCKKLNWKVTSGNSKKAQFNALSRYCKWGKDGYKIVIKEIFEKPIAEISKGKFKKDIEIILLDILSKTDGIIYQTTITKLMRALDIINDNYLTGLSERNLICRKLNVDEQTVNEVYYILNRYKVIIKNALRDLSNRCLISYSFRNVLCCNEKVYDEKLGQEVEKTIYRDATPEEEEFVLNIEKEVMDEMKVSNKLYFILNYNKGKLWRKTVSERLQVRDINYMFEIYDIVFTKKHIIKELKKRESVQIREKLNNKILDSVLNTINNGQITISDEVKELIDSDFYTLEEVYDMDLKYERDKLRVKKNYIPDCTKVAKSIITRTIRTRDKL